MHPLIIRAYEDGGNPRADSDIIRTENGFLLRPFNEDGDTSYKFHINAEIVNPTDRAIETDITIEWFTNEHPQLRDHMQLHSEGDVLTWIPAAASGTRQSATVTVPPGAHCLCMNPRYPLARLHALLDGLDKSVFTVKTIGKTRMNRDFHAIEAGNPDAPVMAIIARVYPYETVSSFCIEGILEWLSGAEGAAFLRNHRLAVIPMANPDGVWLGNHKTTYGGMNLGGNMVQSMEPEAVAIRDYFTGLNPRLLADLRGWLARYDDSVIDGWLNRCGDAMKTNSIARGPAVYAAMIPHSEGINMEYIDPAGYARQDGMGGMLLDRCGTDYVTATWTHRGRNIEQMKTLGVVFLQAAAGETTMEQWREGFSNE